MNPALTVKSQVTIPKPIRDYLRISPGSRVKFEPLPDGRVALSSATPVQKGEQLDPWEAMRGAAQNKFTTEDLMVLSRGKDWNKS